MNYTALQVKTSYSLLQSLNEIKKLVARAVSLGYTSLAITDVNNMFGVPEFYQECKNNHIKPIIGIELNIENKKILLYAMNQQGYKNLIKLSTLVSEHSLTKEELNFYKEGILLIMPYDDFDNTIYQIYPNHYIGYRNKEQREKIKEDKVLINDVSYLYKEDYKYLDYLYMIKELKVLGEYELNTHQGKHLLAKEELMDLTTEIDINTTKLISDLCNVELSYEKGLLPVYDEKIDAYTYLKYLCNKGLKRRLKDNVPEVYIKRLEKELSIIKQMDFCNYFLIVWDYVKYAKQNNILVGPGRGSAAGSLVSYTLGIIDIDPIKYDLLFERFLNPERITMPDIDVDFDSERRQDVINYVIEKYGEKKVAGIITFDTLAAKQVVRDVARILEISPSDTDYLTKLLSSKETLSETIKNNIKLKRLIDENPKYQRLFDISIHLEGLPRNIGIHASGIVMSHRDIDETIPLYKNNRGIYTTAYSMNYLEPLGLLKMDFLGISNLTLIQEVITNIKKNENLNITFSNIPLDDKKTLEIFRKVKTDGIFQFESAGMRRFLEKLQVSSFDDLIAALALYRPGAMDFIDNYIRRKNGQELVEYPDKSLEPILKSTYGIIIYQEQILEIARTLAGYSLGEADILRRAISKKKEEILLKEKPKFIEKSIQNGYTAKTAEKIYDLILKFANYGFNKSHSVGYATVAYKMAFLKTYFFKYFETAILNNVIGNDTKTKIYLAEIRQNNIKILPPDINVSTDKYEVQEDSIRCPLSIINNVGTLISREIIKKRENSPYKDFIDFVIRTYSIGINKKVLISLIKAGCFNSFGTNELTLINNLDNIINYADLTKDAGLIELSIPTLVPYDDYTKEEKIENQLTIFGFYLSNHPTNIYKTAYDLDTRSIEENFDKTITLVLSIDQIKEVTTKKNDIMAFVTASDEYGQISLTLFPKIYKEHNNIDKKDIIKIYGRVEKRFDQYQIIVNNLKILEKKNQN
ncbi:MAG: DNA polymerase III subunit alpha [Erysipelotrichaceae bacterium]|nr:DNA polymerase III subunit alpha [Erysipelotrichaceae bacterium]